MCKCCQTLECQCEHEVVYASIKGYKCIQCENIITKEDYKFDYILETDLSFEDAVQTFYDCLDYGNNYEMAIEFVNKATEKTKWI